ncbi:hypothetical protein B4109_1187 [Geobacillus stearothermophilus]|uniref:Core-binding (CB) domain-containing protein n=2 Tax=Geobacillus stearothermophilus TaxID=1422 RepID=A0A150MZK1_GEOSE|nr:hypothetical protein B4109_1187 [Geobacillus stearothermophilus]
MEGTYFKPSAQDFESFINEWFETVYCQDKSETTIETRRYIIDGHLIPYFKKMPIKDINTRVIDTFFAELRKNGRYPRKKTEHEEKENKDLSESYLHIIFSLLNQAFKKAVAWGLIKANPWKTLKKFRLRIIKVKKIRHGRKKR